MHIIPELECHGEGTVIRGRLPELCFKCGKPGAYEPELSARYIPQATPFACKHCGAIEYVSIQPPNILA